MEGAAAEAIRQFVLQGLPTTRTRTSPAALAANAVVETVRNVAAPTGQIFSAAVPSPGGGTGYGVPAGVVFGYPMRGTAPGQMEIVQGIQHDAWAAERIETTLNELIEERDAVGALAA